MKNIITYDFGLSKTPGAKLKKFLDSFSKCTLAIFFLSVHFCQFDWIDCIFHNEALLGLNRPQTERIFLHGKTHLRKVPYFEGKILFNHLLGYV